MTNSMNIGLLGGTFDPPHIGHTLIAQQVLDFCVVDEIWFVPTYNHTFQKPMSKPADRLAMTRMIQLPKTRVCALEIDHMLNGQTIDLLPLLPKEHAYVFVMGSDQLPTFHLWGRWQELLKQIPFLVFPRYGYPNEPLYENMTVLSDESLIAANISSTKIRERVKRGLSIDHFVPKGVGEYIEEHRLYT